MHSVRRRLQAAVPEKSTRTVKTLPVPKLQTSDPHQKRKRLHTGREWHKPPPCAGPCRGLAAIAAVCLVSLRWRPAEGARKPVLWRAASEPSTVADCRSQCAQAVLRGYGTAANDAGPVAVPVTTEHPRTQWGCGTAGAVSVPAS